VNQTTWTDVAVGDRSIGSVSIANESRTLAEVRPAAAKQALRRPSAEMPAAYRTGSHRTDVGMARTAT